MGGSLKMKLSDKEILTELYRLKDCAPEEYPDEAVKIFKFAHSQALDDVYLRFMNALCSCEMTNGTCDFCVALKELKYEEEE